MMTIEMEVIVYGFGYRAADPVHFGQVVNTRPNDALKAAELFEQFPSSFWPEAWNLLQSRGVPLFRPPAPVARHGKAVRFIANLLDQVQRRRIRCQKQGRPRTGPEQPLGPGFPCPALCHCDDQKPIQFEFVQYRLCRSKLALAAVDEQHVRHWDFALPNSRIPAPQCFGHRCVVIAGRLRFQVETSVVALQRPCRVEYNAGSNGGLARCVTDVEALEPLNWFVKLKRFFERSQLPTNGCIACRLYIKTLLGIRPRHLQPPKPVASDARLDPNFPACAHTKLSLEQFGISPKAVASLRPLEREAEGGGKPRLELTPPPPEVSP